MKRLLVAALLGLTLTVGACQTVSGFLGHPAPANPFAQVTQPDTQVLAAYGLVTIALEQAATVAENRNTPNAVVQQLARLAPRVKAAADIARDAAVEYRHAVVAYNQAHAAGLNDTTALLSASAQAGVRLQSTIADLRTQLGLLEGAVRGVPGSAAGSIQAAAEQLPASTH